MQCKLKSFILCAHAFLLAFLLTLTSICQAQPPNIIFILADDLGYGELGSYNAENTKTPIIDELANKGITYTRAYANSTVCSPSRAAILFGDYPDKLGVPGVVRDMEYNTWGNLRDDAVGLPEKLKQKGYQTALIGKWHLGYQAPDLPNDRGFDYFKGFVGDMMDDYYTHLRGGVNWMRENQTTINPEGHATDLFTDWSVNYIKQQAKSEDPFFLFLAYNAPHDPVQPPEEFLEDVKSRHPDLPLKRQKMIAFVEHLDQNIGKVVRELEKQQIDKETLIIFTSDNGGALNHGARNLPYNGGKGDMLEGGIRVPCIVSWKGMIDSKVVNKPFLLMDFYDHLVALPDDANSVVNNLSNSPSEGDMIWMRREGHKFGGRAYYAISDGKFKLLQNGPFEPYQLFDLSLDSLETSPINNPKAEKELYKKLMKHIQESGKTPWQ